LNEPVFVECARALARKALQEGGKTDEERVVYAFRQVVSRFPTKVEKQELLSMLERENRHFGEGWSNPRQLSDFKADEKGSLSPTQLAAWTAVSRVLLNLDETITKD
jgi:hypothetical protein